MDVRDKKSISSAVKRVTVCFITAALFASAFFSESMAAAYSYSAGGGVASGASSIAIGDNNPKDTTKASGSQSVAIGVNCAAVGRFSTAVGGFSDVASGEFATAIGYCADVAGDYGLAIGSKSVVTVGYGVAIGGKSVANRKTTGMYVPLLTKASADNRENDMVIR